MSESDLRFGITVRGHVDRMMATVDQVVAESFTEIRSGKKLKPKQREHLWRELAGAVAKLEGIRFWLDKGAPE